MIRVEIFERHGANLYKTLVDAMRTGDLRTFSVKDRGRTVTHVRYPGKMKWSSSGGVIVGELRGPRSTENAWQLLGALLGRLAHKYADRVVNVSVQFPEAAGAKPAKKRAAGKRKKR